MEDISTEKAAGSEQVIFVPASQDALARCMDRDEMSRTDITNRAVQLYDFIRLHQEAGWQLLMQAPGSDGGLHRVEFS